MPEVHVIVVNWNGGDVAADCVRSVAAQTVRPVVWVVDNASTDGSAEVLARVPGDVRVLRQPANLGYAAGNNVAWRETASATHLLLLNNDAALPQPDALARAVAELDAHPAVGGACGRFEYPDGGFQHFYSRLPTLRTLLTQYACGRYVRAWREGPELERHLMRATDFTRAQDFEQPAFACVLLAAPAARAVGLLDERFPLFFNDVDYCWRWRQHGYAWRYLPDWRVVHHHGRSVKRLGGRLAAEMQASAVRFVRKHFTPPAAWFFQAAVGLDVAWANRRARAPEFSAWRVGAGRSFFPPPA
jgi:GT2 family glycosyltransferase